MKSELIKSLFIIRLIGNKLSKKNIIKYDIISEKDIDYLVSKNFVCVQTNEHGEWLYINPLTASSIITKAVDNMSDIISLSINLK